ncbi:NAD-dependent epimerase/dehydratase family protein [Solimonas sp. K1W22B-7]|uniref:NAD-dependent epimerase/dehydratase family protein n=1 Tax=Solimonas sp. K1W22B-7 TaxID=2303331 RepID=UPI0013C51D40|nr:NAD-dependent epimerase/dehydratase family protein [Solimonas sp. K1W22B-7]
MTTIAITGIGGFIGLRMLQRARERGWQVRGLDVSPAAAQRARDAGAEVFAGDINDAALLARCFAGADIVFHTAAIVEEDGARELYERVNVEGTRSVCRTAQALGVRQMVQLSSVMVYGFDYPDGVTEEGPFRDDGNIYNETKLRSERVAMEFHRPGAFEVIVIRPGDVYGTGSVPWVLRPIALLQQRLFTLPDGGQGVINHVHVDNLLDGVFLALEKNAGGECFTISDGVATPCREFFGYHARMLGRERVPTAPGALLIALVGALAWGYRLFGRKPPASAAGIHFLRRRGAYSIDKARRQLGYVPKVSLEQGMAEIARERRR